MCGYRCFLDAFGIVTDTSFYGNIIAGTLILLVFGLVMFTGPKSTMQFVPRLTFVSVYSGLFGDRPVLPMARQMDSAQVDEALGSLALVALNAEDP